MRWLVLVLLLSFGAIGFAQQPGIDGIAEVETGYVRLRTVISGLTDGELVSGTSAPFSAHAMVVGLPRDEDAGPEDVINARLDEFKVEISGEVVYPRPGSAYSEFVHVSFASTHFSHGSAIPLRVSAKWSVQKAKHRGTLIYEPEQKSLSCQITVFAYNVGLTLHTDEVRTEDGYRVPSQPTTSDWDTVSKFASARGRIALSGLNHQIRAGGTLSKAELQKQLTPMTVFFGFTHGEATSFRATRDGALSFETSNNELQSAVSSRALRYPLPRLVVMHSGSLLSIPVLECSWFGTRAGTRIALGQAFAGFDQPLNDHPEMIARHATWIYESLASGDSIGTAVHEADQIVQIRNPYTNGKIQMKVIGDPHVRLKNVYTGTSVSSSWYRVRTIL